MGIEVVKRFFTRNPEKKKKESYAFNLLFLKRFYKLHGLLFPQWRSLPSLFFLLLILAEALEQFLAYKVGLISGKFYKVLEEKDKKEFVNHVMYSLAMILSISFVKTGRVFVTKQLVVSWRKSLTEALHKAYFANMKFYLLNSQGKQNNLKSFPKIAERRILVRTLPVEGAPCKAGSFAPITVDLFIFQACPTWTMPTSASLPT